MGRKRLNETSLSDEEDAPEVDIASSRATDKRRVRKRVREGAPLAINNAVSPTTGAAPEDLTVRQTQRTSTSSVVIDVDNITDPKSGILATDTAQLTGVDDGDEEFVAPESSSSSSDEDAEEDDMDPEIIEIDDDNDKPATPAAPAKGTGKGALRTNPAINPNVARAPSKKRRKQKSKHDERVDPQHVDASGMLADLSHLAPARDEQAALSPTADLNAFFGPIFKDDEGKLRRTCLICKEPKVSDGSTGRRHLDRYHRAEYNKWCIKNKFESKLDSYKSAKKAAEAQKSVGIPITVQSSLDSHLAEKPVPYTDALLRQAVIDWLVETNQPLAAVDHPRFRNMLEVASRAKNGIKIPSRKMTRSEILQIFRKHMVDLKKRLTSNIVLGLISSTCDCWLADNQDGYFAVTGHWIEAASPGLWELKTDLFGYVAIQESHSGKRLGQALYRVFERIGIAHKMGWTTADGVDVNDVMMSEVEVWQIKNGITDFKSHERRIFCNAHIINLPVQDFIKARADKNKRTPGHRDEISLVRDIAVKQRCGAMRKLRFHKLATEKGLKPRNLLRDMPVRWSSSSFMLDRAWALRSIVNKFVFELKEDESSQKKKAILAKMLISDEEWVRIDLNREIFHLADEAQQMFSAERYPTLYNAMPALVSLLAAWKKRRSLPKFEDLSEAIDAAIDKLQKHVSKIRIAALSARPYWVTMVLHPDFKLGRRFRKFWDTLTPTFEVDMEKLFQQRYESLNKSATPAATSQSTQHGSRLLDELSDGEEDNHSSTNSSQPSVPWKTEYRAWLDAHHELGKDMTLVRMWGVLATQYPTWASLAADYLAVMGSSVSSERAFSGGGLVVTDKRGSLKGDIVEALQCVKCALRNDLLVHPDMPSSIVEQQVVVEDSDEEAEADVDATASVEWILNIVDSDDESAE